jgi:transcriptional regulator with XRE-family HTH domain
MSNFPNILKQLRIQASMTQKELAEKLHVSQNAVFNWENGKREPGLDMIEKISKLFMVKPSYLLGYETEFIKPQNSLKNSLNNITLLKTNNQKLENVVRSFSRLNSKGQEKAVEQLELLAKIPEYQKEQLQSDPTSDVNTLDT